MSQGVAILFWMSMVITFASMLSKHFVHVNYSTFIQQYLLVPTIFHALF